MARAIIGRVADTIHAAATAVTLPDYAPTHATGR